MLHEKHWTHTLRYTDKYKDMQARLEITIEKINKHIITMNRDTKASTPFTHSIIYKRRGKRPSYYKWIYSLLEDGVHGTTQTKKGWAHCILKAIEANRSQNTQGADTQEQTQPMATDTPYEQSLTNTDHTDTEEYHTDTEDFHTDTEDYHTDTDDHHTDTDNQLTDSKDQHTDTENKHTDTDDDFKSPKRAWMNERRLNFSV